MDASGGLRGFYRIDGRRRVSPRQHIPCWILWTWILDMENPSNPIRLFDLDLIDPNKSHLDPILLVIPSGSYCGDKSPCLIASSGVVQDSDTNKLRETVEATFWGPVSVSSWLGEGQTNDGVQLNKNPPWGFSLLVLHVVQLLMRQGF